MHRDKDRDLWNTIYRIHCGFKPPLLLCISPAEEHQILRDNSQILHVSEWSPLAGTRRCTHLFGLPSYFWTSMGLSSPQLDMCKFQTHVVLAILGSTVYLKATN